MTEEYTSKFFEKAAKSLLWRSAEYLVSANAYSENPIYRDLCRRLAFQEAQDATKAFAVARSYRLRGK
jgi:hypothetical protein